jgi:hypothetical protein
MKADAQPTCFYGSVTRTTDLRERAWQAHPLPREQWAEGDLVAGDVVAMGANTLRIETPSGRYAEPMAGDRIVGAFGTRFATLELVGSWRDIVDDTQMEVITGGGVIGRTTSKSPFIPPTIKLRYAGHVHVDGRPRALPDYTRTVPERRLAMPVVMIIGTSMSAGKTTAAKVIVRLLRQMGRRVVGAKLTGAGRYSDILAMRDAGAEWIYDFVDVGLSTTVVPREQYRSAATQLLSRLAGTAADVAVIEAGASPLEPYGGDEAVALIDDAIRCTVLCSSDPYAVVGIMKAFQRRPDVATGIATNTAAGIALIEKLSGVAALNVRDAADHPRLAHILAACLDSSERGADGHPQPS